MINYLTVFETRVKASSVFEYCTLAPSFDNNIVISDL